MDQPSVAAGDWPAAPTSTRTEYEVEKILRVKGSAAIRCRYLIQMEGLWGRLEHVGAKENLLIGCEAASAKRSPVNSSRRSGSRNEKIRNSRRRSQQEQQERQNKPARTVRLHRLLAACDLNWADEAREWRTALTAALRQGNVAAVRCCCSTAVPSTPGVSCLPHRLCQLLHPVMLLVSPDSCWKWTSSRQRIQRSHVLGNHPSSCEMHPQFLRIPHALPIVHSQKLPPLAGELLCLLQRHCDPLRRLCPTAPNQLYG
uniref:Uncharacterized protein n=1 Tax=Macrostomum lignano TaxID=282301 RepID=A0A1I8FG73_9PLAT